VETTIRVPEYAEQFRLPDPATEPTMTVPRASGVVKVSVRAGYDAVARGEWPTIRIGRSVRVLTAKFLAQYGLDDHDVPTSPEAA